MSLNNALLILFSVIILPKLYVWVTFNVLELDPIYFPNFIPDKYLIQSNN